MSLVACRRLNRELRRSGARVTLRINHRRKCSVASQVKLLKSFDCVVEMHCPAGALLHPVFTKALEEGWRGPTILDLSHQSSFKFDDARLMDRGLHALTDNGAIALSAVLPLCRHLQHLDLTQNQLGIKGFMKLAGALQTLTLLTHLNLGMNRTCPASARRLASSLPSCPLTYLDLSVDPAWVDKNATTIPILCEVLPACTGLKTLNLSGHLCGAGGAARLAQALPACSALVHLLLASNDFVHEGMRLLAPGLEQSRMLETLDLGLNQIDGEGAGVLAEVMVLLPRLRVLSLKANGIEDSGCTHLATALPRCIRLESLDLASNGIEALGIQPLAHALTLSPGLASLNLACNLLDSHAVGLLADALAASPSLSSLSLRANEIDDRGATRLATVLPQCNLTALDISSSDIGDRGAAKLAIAVSKASQLTSLHIGDNSAISEEGRARLWRSCHPALSLPGLPPPPQPRPPLLVELRVLLRRLGEQPLAAIDHT